MLHSSRGLYSASPPQGLMASILHGVRTTKSSKIVQGRARLIPFPLLACREVPLALRFPIFEQKRWKSLPLRCGMGNSSFRSFFSLYLSSVICGKRCVSQNAASEATSAPAWPFSSSAYSSSTVNSSEGNPSSTSFSHPFISSQKKGKMSFTYRPRWKYSAPFRSSSLTDYMYCKDKTHAVSIARTYRHRVNTDVTITLIPLRHLAHPLFYSQVDALCQQHESVLMEGRTPTTGAPFSTLVPPRDPIPANQRPLDHEDDEGWEPRAIEDFFQPFSWGVNNSPVHTVIHAADKYDYERLPWYCSLRFNFPLLGSFEREKHCLNVIPFLVENGYKSFAIPWGAGHMCIFHEMLLGNGFEPVGMCSLLMFNRIDGEHSEAELLKMLNYEKRIARRVNLAYITGALMVLYFLSSMFEVEFSGPPKRLPS